MERRSRVPAGAKMGDGRDLTQVLGLHRGARISRPGDRGGDKTIFKEKRSCAELTSRKKKLRSGQEVFRPDRGGGLALRVLKE